jgi:(1->4)-alpha-D-glucan 1-alpha-D-glucosylmutase
MADSGREDAARAPRATYRLQLRKGFGFARAAELVPYLEALGIGDVYASPILAARPGSAHGYDVTDPSRLNPELGTEAEFAALADDLRARGMGCWWTSCPTTWPRVPSWERGEGKVVLPVLGAPLEEVIRRGELSITREGAGGEIRYYDKRFPISGEAGAEIERVLVRQHYTLVFWKEGPRRINYRRFFDISDLVGVNAWRQDVFAAHHERILREVRAGRITGLRVDHIDGLRDPADYLRRLRDNAGDTEGGTPYIIVEKILGKGERLPESWPVRGTTGYDALNHLQSLFVDPEGARVLLEDAQEELGLAATLEDECLACKKIAVERMFPGDLDSLAHALSRETASQPRLREAFAALSTGLRVYRTYLGADEPR